MKNLKIAILMTLVTTLLFGLIYALAVTGLAQLLFPAQANGRWRQKDVSKRMAKRRGGATAVPENRPAKSITLRRLFRFSTSA
jgi:K+-transporting ATPase c subunit